MVGIKSDVGIVRSLNEDFAGYIEEKDFSLYIVADGMGGHNAGEVASEMAVKSVEEYVKENYIIRYHCFYFQTDKTFQKGKQAISS